jgi:hypothetical protein
MTLTVLPKIWQSSAPQNSQKVAKKESPMLSTRISPQIRHRLFSSLASSTIPINEDVKLIPTCGPISKFSKTDPLKLDLMLTEEERGMRDAARAFCQDELADGIVMANRHEKFDRGIMKVRQGMGSFEIRNPFRDDA